MSSGDASLEDAVRAWLDEEKNYHGEKIGEGDFMSWGHYSKFQHLIFFPFRYHPTSSLPFLCNMFISPIVLPQTHFKSPARKELT